MEGQESKLWMKLKSKTEFIMEKIELKKKYEGHDCDKLQFGEFEILQGVSKIVLQMMPQNQTRNAILISVRDKLKGQPLMQAEIEKLQGAVIRRVNNNWPIAMMIDRLHEENNRSNSEENLCTFIVHPGGTRLMKIEKIRKESNHNQINVDKISKSGRMTNILQAVPLNTIRKKLGKLFGVRYPCKGLKLHINGRVLATLKPKRNRNRESALCSLKFTQNCTTSEQYAAVIGLTTVVLMKSLL